MTKFVRIRTENDMETSVSAVHAKSVGAKVLDVDATDSRGKPLPATRKGGRRALPQTTVSEAAAKKTATSKAAKPAGPATPTGGSTADRSEGDTK